MTTVGIDKSKLTVAELENNYMTVAEFAKKVVPGSPYQYARQIVLSGRYNLEVVELTVGDEAEPRRYISKKSVMACIEIRKHNKAEREAKASSK